jgi:colanic acid biosynthesis glycosyl transferase WcaI
MNKLQGLNKPKILVLSSNFFPEETGIGIYATDLVYGILKERYQVSVITGLPHYPWWKIPKKFSHYKSGLKDERSVKVRRINHYIPRTPNAFGRARFELSFFLLGLPLISKVKKNDYDLVIAYVPNIACGLLARLIALKCKIPYLIICEDLSFLGTIQSGIPFGKLFYLPVKFLEKNVLKNARIVVAISDEINANIHNLVGRNVTVKIETLFNYAVHTQNNIEKSTARLKLGISSDCFIVTHSGNMGFKQDLVSVVKAAEYLLPYPKIRFIFIGNGSQKKDLVTAASGISNIEILDLLPVEEYLLTLSSSDVLLVNERSTMEGMSLPSKLITYFNSDRPILAAVPGASATRKFLNGKAYLVKPGEPVFLADAILHLMKNPQLQDDLRRKAKEFSRNHLRSDTAREKYLLVIASALNGGN